MPNETRNLLKIQGEQDLIDKFINSHKQINEYDLIYWDFEHSAPLLSNSNDENIKENTWGTNRGIVTHCSNNEVSIETPWTPCDIWFKTMIIKYPELNFILKYNDEYAEDFDNLRVLAACEFFRSPKIKILLLTSLTINAHILTFFVSPRKPGFCLIGLTSTTHTII